MKSAEATGLFVEIGQSHCQAFCGGDAYSLPLECSENGRLTDLCREQLVAGLRGFLSQKGRGAGRNAFCAIGARGVSMRRLTLPASSEDELKRVLRLQIESEFPLSPDQLAWGSRRVGPPKPSANGGALRQELLVVAVKKEALEEFAGVLASCGVVPFFTLAALARAEVYHPPSGTCAVLDMGEAGSELTAFEDAVPASIRVLPWSGDNNALEPLARALPTAVLGGKLYLTGKSARVREGLAPALAGLLGGAVTCQSLEQTGGSGPTAAIAGLVKSTANGSASPPLLLQLDVEQKAPKAARHPIWKWAAAAVLLAVATLIFPYAQAIVMKPFLEKKLTALEADRGRLATIDEELDFLQFLKQNQPPYLDTIYLLAYSAPNGMQLESLQMGRNKEVSLRLKFANTQQVSDFRSKLIDSGWFTDVVVAEQAPSPDRRISVRMTASLKPPETRKPLPEPTGQKRDKSGPSAWSNFGAPPPQMPMPGSASAPAPSRRPVMAPPGPPGGPDGDSVPRPRRSRRVFVPPNS